MSSIPASAITSASPSFWQVMPRAPALTCACASNGLLWVLICGRLATPAASQDACTRAMLRSTLSKSMTAQGVPYSLAIFAARGVVMGSGAFYLFTHHFKLQPAVLGFLQFVLSRRQRVRCLVEFLPILVVEIGIVKEPLLLGDLGLQFGYGLRQCFQRVLLVEIQLALRCAGSSPSLERFGGLRRGILRRFAL